jgi:hypothetical protein
MYRYFDIRNVENMKAIGFLFLLLASSVLSSGEARPVKENYKVQDVLDLSEYGMGTFKGRLSMQCERFRVM